jgi:hypothetical protein
MRGEAQRGVCVLSERSYASIPACVKAYCIDVGRGFTLTFVNLFILYIVFFKIKTVCMNAYVAHVK